MATSTQLRSWWAAYKCNPNKMVRVKFPTPIDTIGLLVAAEAAPAWRLFADLMVKHEYYFKELAGGTYKCRLIDGTNAYSLHSYGTALDLNPAKNPYKLPLTHNYPAAFITDVLAQKGTNGAPLFRWGGTWSTPDAMHWEINVPPTAIPEYEGGDDMAAIQVEDLQEALLAAGLKGADGNDIEVDGIWGENSKHALVQGLKNGAIARDRAAKANTRLNTLHEV